MRRSAITEERRLLKMHAPVKFKAAWRDVLQSARPLSARGTAALEYAALGWESLPGAPRDQKSHKSEKHGGDKVG